MASTRKVHICLSKTLYRFGDCRTPLLFAIICKAMGTAKYLLDHGADPNKPSNDGFSPLHCASKSGDCETVELLLVKGAYVDPVAFCGTPLHCAASGDHYSTSKILLDHNADCNKMVNGKTPIIAAIDADSRNCMLLLTRAGADRKGALTYAIENLHAENLVSTDFANCIIEDVAANHVVPDDDEPVSKKKIRAAGFKKLANHSFKKKDYLAAAGSYSVSMALDPEDATVYSNRSACSLLMGDGENALVDADYCRKMRPDWPKACYRQGAALMSLKDYKGACERFLDGLKLDPANTEIEAALRFVYVPAPHTAEVLCDVLHEVLVEFHLERKISTITLDNCTTNDKAMEDLLDKLDSSSLMLGGRLLHMRC